MPSTPHAVLVDLLQSLFSSGDELRAFLRRLEGGVGLAKTLPEGKSLAVLADETASLLHRRGRLDAALFQELVNVLALEGASLAAVRRTAVVCGIQAPTANPAPSCLFPGERWDLFLSYAHADEAKAKRIHALLAARGLTVFMDAVDAVPGQPLHRELSRGIRSSEWFLALVTRSYVRAWTGWETGVADEHRQQDRIIVLLDGSTPAPGPLLNIVPIRLAADEAFWRHPLDKLWAAVRGLPQPPAPAAVPQPLAPPAPMALIEGYLRYLEGYAVESCAGEMGIPVLKVYVEVAASAIHDDFGPCRVGIAAGSRHRLADLVEGNRTRCWSIQGDPGSGKTTALRHLAAARARATLAWLAENGSLEAASIPVYAPLALLEGRATPCAAAAAEYADLFLDDDQAQQLREALDWAVQQGRACVLLDGWDELRPAVRIRVQKKVQAWANQHRERTPFLLASRRIGYLRPDARFAELELLPLDGAAREELVNKLLPGKAQAQAVLALVREGPLAVRELAGNPFLLTLLCILARDRELGARLPGYRVELYRMLLDRLLDKVGVGFLRASLAAFALELLQRHGGPWSVEELHDAAGSGLREHAADHLLPGRQPRQAVADRVAGIGLLRAVDRARSRFGPWHRSLLEMLAAEALPAGNEQALEVISRLDLAGAGLGAWAEVFALYAGLRGGGGDPTALFLRLRKIHPDLALRAMAASDQIPVQQVARAMGLQGAEAAGPLRQVILRVADQPAEREDTLRFLVDLAQKAGDDLPLLQLLGAALLAVGAGERELGAVRRKAGAALGIPDMPWVEIPAGSFLMGSANGEPESFNDERPQHEVHITGPFRMLATPVTQALYLLVTGKNPSEFKGDLRRPVEKVRWDHAVAFCEALSRLMGRVVRLPREAEWEYACRAGTTGPRYGPVDDIAWYEKNSGAATHPVGEKLPNAWGLFDMLGNVVEWCADAWEGDYAKHAAGRTINPADPPPAGGADRVIRGGSFADSARWARSAFRILLDPWLDWPYLGFRVVLPQ